MLLVAIIYFLLILIESYLLGKTANKILFKNNLFICSSVLGFFILLGLFQIVVIPVVYFQWSSSILGYWIIILLLSIPVLAFIARIEIIPHKGEWFCFVIGVIVCFVYGFVTYKQTLGIEAFDTIFYLSTTLHNSSAEILGNYAGYGGNTISGVSLLYDYQGIYHFYAQFLKFSRLFFEFNYELTPIYMWTASLTYFYLLAATIINCVDTFFRNNGKLVKLSALLFSFMFFTNYYNTSFSFYGNTMKTLAVTILILLIYQWIDKNKSSYTLIIILFLGLIACSSSGLFQSIFIYAGILFAIGVKPLKSRKDYFWVSLLCLPLLIYGMIIIQADVLLVLPDLIKKLLPAAYVLFVLIFYLIRFIPKSIIKKVYLIILVLLTLALVLISIIISPEVKGGFSYFFTKFSAFDMTLDYFSFDNYMEIYRNLMVYILVLGGIVLSNRKSRMRIFIITILLLFMNPLVAPAIYKFLTNVVYGRCLEVIVNPAVLLWGGAVVCKRIGDRSVFGLGSEFVIGILSVCLGLQNLILPYNHMFIPGEGYDGIFRVDKTQMELYKAVEDTVNMLNEKPRVLSQDYGVKGYVDNIELVLSVSEMHSAPVYEEIKGPTTNELLNIFYPRDYPGQKVWDDDPDYTRACPVIEANDIDYIIMAKDVTIDRGDGVFEPLWLHIRSCAKELYNNEDYVFLKRVNWAEEQQ